MRDNALTSSERCPAGSETLESWLLSGLSGSSSGIECRASRPDLSIEYAEACVFIDAAIAGEFGWRYWDPSGFTKSKIFSVDKLIRFSGAVSGKCLSNAPR